MFRLHRAAIVSAEPSSPERIPRKQFFVRFRLFNQWVDGIRVRIDFSFPETATCRNPGHESGCIVHNQTWKWKQNERTDRLKWRNTEIGAFHEFLNQCLEHLGWFDPNDSVNRTRFKMKCTRIECSTLTSEVRFWAVFWLMDTFEMLVINFTLIRLLTTSHDSSRTCLSLSRAPSVHTQTEHSRMNFSI